MKMLTLLFCLTACTASPAVTPIPSVALNIHKPTVSIKRMLAGPDSAIVTAGTITPGGSPTDSVRVTLRKDGVNGQTLTGPASQTRFAFAITGVGPSQTVQLSATNAAHNLAGWGNTSPPGPSVPYTGVDSPPLIGSPTAIVVKVSP